MTPSNRDAEKAAANWRNHGVPFDQAVEAYLDPFAVELIDEREDYERNGSTLLACAATCCCT